MDTIPAGTFQQIQRSMVETNLVLISFGQNEKHTISLQFRTLVPDKLVLSKLVEVDLKTGYVQQYHQPEVMFLIFDDLTNDGAQYLSIRASISQKSGF
jgi:hypothetical protein